MKIILATWLLEPSQGRALTKSGQPNRLLSYHFLREEGITKKQLGEYVKTGKLDTRKKK